MIIPFLSFIILTVLFFRGGWIEFDSYAFISRACGTSSFDSPIISQLFFNAIPCNLIIWFVFQAIIWGITLTAMSKTLKRNGFPENSLFYLGFSLSAIYSLLAFEDDFLLTGPFFVLSLELLLRPTFNKKIIYSIFILLGGLLFWKGIFVVGGIVLFAAISPILSVLPVLAYFSINGLNSWQNSIEGAVFSGWTVFIPIIILLFFGEKQKIIELYKKNKRILLVFFSFLILGFYQIKWGLYSALFLPIIFSLVLKDEKKEFLATLGLLVLVLSIIGIGLTKSPHESHWKVLEKAIELERKGNSIYIDQGFGLEKWGYEYLGGKPIYGEKPISYYYLGVSPIKNCTIIEKQDNLVLGYCSQ